MYSCDDLIKRQLKIKNVGAALAAAQLRTDERNERRDRLWAIPNEEEVFLRSEKIKNESALDKEKLEKETKGLETLAGLLGGDTKQIKETKKQVSGMNGTATYWIDPAKDKFIARKHVYLNMNGCVCLANLYIAGKRIYSLVI